MISERRDWFKPDEFSCLTHGGGGGFSAKFRVGVCRPQFQNGTVALARPIFVKMIPLARINSPLKVLSKGVF